MRDMSGKEFYSDGAPAPLASVNAPPVEQERARIYSASLSLEVTRIETVRNSLGGRALELGGRIEAISSEGIIVLVPAEYFFSYIDEAKAYGVLLDRNITALDVSETLAETETRLKIARESRSRLYELLENSSDAEERLAILREIRRLSETVENLEQQIATMRERIAFSRVAVRLTARMGDRGESRSRIPFVWMRRLDPFGVTLGTLEEKGIDPGGSFAVFKEPPAGEAFYAESADGAVLRMGSVRNEPAGDGFFWQTAMLNYMAPLYARVTAVNIEGREGSLYGVSCSITGDPGYTYEVFALPGGRNLIVAEGLFPAKGDPGLTGLFHDALKERF